MNLRKTIDKAKQVRGNAPPVRLTSGKPVVITKSPGSEWTPPAYSDSCCREIEAESLTANRCVCIAPDADELESYRVLTPTPIQQVMKSKCWNTLHATSPNTGDEKTLTPINLAFTFSRDNNQTVMRIDRDLRRQSVQRVLGLESEAGVGENGKTYYY